MSDVTIRVDASKALAGLDRLSKQVPFATSRAVNEVAKDAQAALRSQFGQSFTLRRPDFIAREGAKITQFATKARPVAVVGVTPKADFLTKFTTGGEKRPKEGRSIAIPVDARRNKRDIITSGNRPRALLANPRSKAFLRRQGTTGAILRTMGRGRAAFTRVLYVLKARVMVPKSLPYEPVVRAAVHANWPQRMRAAFADARRTAK